MIKIITGLPDNVLGVSAEGKITGDDYEKVLIPAVEKKLETHKKMRLLYYLGSDFKEFEINAVLDDAKIGIKHLFAWDKLALVSDHPMINTFVKFFGYMIPCDIKIFKNGDFENAKKWISEG